MNDRTCEFTNSSLNSVSGVCPSKRQKKFACGTSLPFRKPCGNMVFQSKVIFTRKLSDDRFALLSLGGPPARGGGLAILPASGCGTPSVSGTVPLQDVSTRATGRLGSAFAWEKGESGQHFAAAAPEDLCLSKMQ